MFTSSSVRLRLLVLTGDVPSPEWWIGKDEEGVEDSRIVAGGETRAWLDGQYDNVQQDLRTCHWDAYRDALDSDLRGPP
jgi:hypothetical protein